jgi:hypothetical protein
MIRNACSAKREDYQLMFKSIHRIAEALIESPLR